ncbi:MAG: HAD family hydrolase [Gammaproteobacteria bacterium]
MPESLALITFDLDDTLWPCDPVIARAEQAHFQWLQRAAPRLTAAHDQTGLRAHRHQLMADKPELSHDFTALRIASLTLLLAEFGYPVSLAEQATAAFREVRNQVTPFPDVLPVLRALKPAYRLISLTNGNAEIRHTPLKEHLHLSLTAAEVGAAKPHPALFERALAASTVPAAEALHVGDDPVRDVEAARRVGMGTVWVNRTAKEWPADLTPPDLTVRDLFELHDWLDGSHQGPSG